MASVALDCRNPDSGCSAAKELVCRSEEAIDSFRPQRTGQGTPHLSLLVFLSLAADQTHSITLLCELWTEEQRSYLGVCIDPVSSEENCSGDLTDMKMSLPSIGLKERCLTRFLPSLDSCPKVGV